MHSGVLSTEDEAGEFEQPVQQLHHTEQADAEEQAGCPADRHCNKTNVSVFIYQILWSEVN